MKTGSDENRSRATRKFGSSLSNLLPLGRNCSSLKGLSVTKTKLPERVTTKGRPAGVGGGELTILRSCTIVGSGSSACLDLSLPGTCFVAGTLAAFSPVLIVEVTGFLNGAVPGVGV